MFVKPNQTQFIQPKIAKESAFAEVFFRFIYDTIFPEGSAKASINWSLDLTGTKLCIKTVELTVGSKCFENGRIIWQLCGGNQCVLPTPGVTMRTEQIAGAKELKVS